MNFRQRIAWLFLFFYLLFSLLTVYYIFELSDKYDALALEHSKIYHSPSAQEDNTWFSSLWCHLPDVPFFMWILVLAIPYLQVFFCLYVCTKPEPKKVLLCCVPFLGWTRIMKSAGKTGKIVYSHHWMDKYNPYFHNNDGSLPLERKSSGNSNSCEYENLNENHSV